MAQIAFRDGGPSAGTAFAFFEEVDKSIKAFLENSGTVLSGDQKDLADFIATEVANIRAHVPRNDMREDESQTQQGVKGTIYIMSYRFRMADYASQSLNLDVTTEFRIWTKDADPQTAGKRCMAISGAVASLMEQTFFAQSTGLDWPDYYAAFSGQGGPEVIAYETDRLALNQENGLARHIGSLTWQYHEDW